MYGSACECLHFPHPTTAAIDDPIVYRSPRFDVPQLFATR